MTFVRLRRDFLVVSRSSCRERRWSVLISRSRDFLPWGALRSWALGHLAIGHRRDAAGAGAGADGHLLCDLASRRNGHPRLRREAAHGGEQG